jgi:hypothetical protein
MLGKFTILLGALDGFFWLYGYEINDVKGITNFNKIWFIIIVKEVGTTFTLPFRLVFKLIQLDIEV